ncbi:MAG: hypothetical protein Q9222_001703 [Ikaeria aurantiellina]
MDSDSHIANTDLPAMPSNEQSGRSINDLLAACTFPDRTKREDSTCLICHEKTLGVNGSEIPTRLHCGHVLGLSCLTTRVLGGILHCPLCHAYIITTRVAERYPEKGPNVEYKAEWLIDWRSEFLGEWLGDDRIVDIKRAEELWDSLCTAILDYMETEFHRTDESVNELIEWLNCFAGPTLMEFLGFGNAYNFYSAFTHPQLQYQPEEWVRRKFHVPYQELVAHLQAMGPISNYWRTYLAFHHGPDMRLLEYRHRLERIDIDLSKRLIEVNSADAVRGRSIGRN